MRAADGVVVGVDALYRLGDELDEVHRQALVPVPLTARRPWLSAWARAFTAYEPMVVRVDGGCALLAARSQAGVLRVAALGHGVSDYTRLPAVDREAAARLGGRVAQALRSLGRPWALDLEQLPLDDPAVDALRDGLPVHAVEDGDACPSTLFGDDRSVGAYLSKNFRSTAGRLRRRAEASRAVEVDFVRDADGVVGLLPELVQVRRRRDADVGRLSPLDTEAGTRFYRDVMGVLAARGEVEVATLRFDGTLAAYSLALVDGTAYRSYDPRFDPAFAEFSPGAMLELPLFERLLADPGVECFDRMRGVEGYKLRTANHVEPTVRLRAWSSAGVHAADEQWRRAKQALKRSSLVRSTVQALKRGRGG